MELVGGLALRVTLGSPSSADSRSVQQPAERAAGCSHLPGGRLHQVRLLV